MSNTRKRYSSEYKVKIVLEILSNTGTLTEIAGKYGLHPTMILGWKTEFLERSKEIFADNIFIERLWRTIKQEEVYLREYNSPIEAMISLKKYMIFYNSQRPHQSLGYKTPGNVYDESIKNKNLNSKVLA